MTIGLPSASYLWRSLRRAPVFTSAVVLTLSIGIGSAAAIFAVVNAVLLRPLPYGNPDRLVGAWHDMPPLSMTHAQQTVGTYLTYKRFAKSIEGIALYDDGSVTLSDPDGRSEVAPARLPRTARGRPRGPTRGQNPGARRCPRCLPRSGSARRPSPPGCNLRRDTDLPGSKANARGGRAIRKHERRLPVAGSARISHVQDCVVSSRGGGGGPCMPR